MPLERTDPKKDGDPWTQSKSLVFVGVELLWRKSIADLAMHTAFGERWERDFANWRISDRSVRLVGTDRYTLTLADGTAEFRIENKSGYARAANHFEDLAQVVASEREKPRLRIQTEYLLAVPDVQPFDEVVKSLSEKLYKDEFHDSLKAELYDFAYLADFRRNGYIFQLSIGVLKAAEVNSRVSAMNLNNPPEVSIFYSISTHKALSAAAHLSGVLRDALDTARIVQGRVKP